MSHGSGSCWWWSGAGGPTHQMLLDLESCCLRCTRGPLDVTRAVILSLCSWCIVRTLCLCLRHQIEVKPRNFTDVAWKLNSLKKGIKHWIVKLTSLWHPVNWWGKVTFSKLALVSIVSMKRVVQKRLSGLSYEEEIGHLRKKQGTRTFRRDFQIALLSSVQSLLPHGLIPNKTFDFLPSFETNQSMNGRNFRFTLYIRTLVAKIIFRFPSSFPCFLVLSGQSFSDRLTLSNQEKWGKSWGESNKTSFLSWLSRESAKAKLCNSHVCRNSHLLSAWASWWIVPPAPSDGSCRAESCWKKMTIPKVQFSKKSRKKPWAKEI